MRAPRVLALLALIALSAVPAWAAPILSITPSLPTVTAGTPFSATIDIAGVTDLYGYNFDILYDSSLVSVIPSGAFLEPVVEGPFLATGGSTFFLSGFDDTAGLISFTASTLSGNVAGATGSGTLATVLFMANAAGTALFYLGNVQLTAGPPILVPIVDVDGNPILDSDGNPTFDTTFAGIAIDLAPGSIDITANAAVPEPSTMLLLGSGLALAARRRSTRRGRTT